jgi:ribosomal protein S18 acetylase RimI-like enzyme
MLFRNLNKIPTATLLDTFNAAFADYFVKLELTEEKLQNKLRSDRIDLALSAGAFKDEQLVGFILHGVDIINDKKIIYNAGTGVIPEYRGKQLTRAMYRFMLPALKAENATKCILEVIDRNRPALKVYSELGFTLKRDLLCFKGKVETTDAQKKYLIKKIDLPQEELIRSFWDWSPSWQNSIAALKIINENNRTIGCYRDNVLVGYLNWNPLNNRIAQFAIDKNYRRLGIARELFQYVQETNNSEITIINVDKRSDHTLKFLGSIGLNPFITQYEMELTIG